MSSIDLTIRQSESLTVALMNGSKTYCSVTFQRSMDASSSKETAYRPRATARSVVLITKVSLVGVGRHPHSGHANIVHISLT